jgi:ubiquinone/menaquinone biosynthesis C-methylase UbiE
MTVREITLPPMETRRRHHDRPRHGDPSALEITHGETGGNESAAALPPSTIYNEEYFLSGACEGLTEFLNGELSMVKRREFELLGVRPGERVLDLGCGRGEASAELLRAGAQPIALDYSASAVKLTQASLDGRAVVIRGDADALPFPAATFDRVLMGDVIEHLPWSIGVATLREIQRVLVPGGQAVIHSSPNVWFVSLVMPPLRTVMRLLGRTEIVNRFNEYERLRHAMHVNELSPRSIGRLMRQAGVPADTWVDGDVLRSGDSEWTASLSQSRSIRLLARIAGTWPLRLAFGNDLYARITIGAAPAPAPGTAPT